MQMPPHMMIGSDPTKIKGATLSKGLVRRVMGFARPYRMMLIGYFVIIVLEALIALVPVLLFKEIVDYLNHQGTDGRKVTVWACWIVVAAMATAGLSFFDRWWSSRIGEAPARTLDRYDRARFAAASRTFVFGAVWSCGLTRLRHVPPMPRSD